ncbi:AraC family transcriptional regulator [Puteibacter caeruleilacunae]|nr:AraC family transcriptional regulator [Puteibacter caeruleilacunae]
MKPFYTKATHEYDNSVTIRYDERANFYPHWHFHDEYELVYIHKSAGIRYVGDSINPFQPGDLVLLGSRLPHIWINKPEESQDKQKEQTLAASSIIHFQRQFIHNSFFELPLMSAVKTLFDRSSRGIRFINFNNPERYLKAIEESNSTERIIEVFKLLSALSQHQSFELLSSNDYYQVASEQRSDRLSKIHNYIATHFREKISLDILADIAHMSPQAFCTYFKNKTRKTVFTYINDLKIGYSCKLLIETDLNIDQVAHQSGYNNTTFFNRKFKEKMNITPMTYRKNFNM